MQPIFYIVNLLPRRGPWRGPRRGGLVGWYNPCAPVYSQSIEESSHVLLTAAFRDEDVHRSHRNRILCTPYIETRQSWRKEKNGIPRKFNFLNNYKYNFNLRDEHEQPRMYHTVGLQYQYLYTILTTAILHT